MRDRGWLSAPFLGFAWLEQVGELFDGEDALLLILAHYPGRDAIKEAEVILLLGLRVARALKGAEQTMLIQNDGRGLRGNLRCRRVEGVKEWQEVCGTRGQFHGVRGAIHRNESTSRRWSGLEMSQDIPGKGECQLLRCTYAIRPHTYRRFIPGLAARRWLLDPAEDVTLRCQAISLETGMTQHRAPVAQVLHCVWVYLRVRVLQAVKVARLILTPLLLQNTHVRMRFTLLWAVQEEVGFPWTLSIRDNDFRRDRMWHDPFLHCSAVVTTLDV
jgi:hypothetical protein